MTNSVDPDETAHYEPSHLDLRCLQKPFIMPVAVKELNFLVCVSVSSVKHFSAMASL